MTTDHINYLNKLKEKIEKDYEEFCSYSEKLSIIDSKNFINFIIDRTNEQVEIFKKIYENRKLKILDQELSVLKTKAYTLQAEIDKIIGHTSTSINSSLVNTPEDKTNITAQTKDEADIAAQTETESETSDSSDGSDGQNAMKRLYGRNRPLTKYNPIKQATKKKAAIKKGQMKKQRN